MSAYPEHLARSVDPRGRDGVLRLWCGEVAAEKEIVFDRRLATCLNCLSSHDASLPETQAAVHLKLIGEALARVASMEKSSDEWMKRSEAAEAALLEERRANRAEDAARGEARFVAMLAATVLGGACAGIANNLNTVSSNDIRTAVSIADGICKATGVSK